MIDGSHKRLIVNADDLGMTASVNRGIVESMDRGIVRSASLMVNLGAHDDATARLRPLLDRGVDVGVGLHFNIVSGRPLTAARSLVASNGEFHRLPALAMRACLHRLDAEDVQAELTAQLERCRAVLRPLGLRPTHIDSHRHSHCLPGVFPLVLATARAADIRHVRHPRDARIGPRRIPGVASLALRLVLPGDRDLDDVRFTGFSLMNSATLDDDLAALIHTLPAGTTELMVHPGYDSAELAAMDPYREPREREVRALTQPRLLELLRESRTELTHFGATARAA